MHRPFTAITLAIALLLVACGSPLTGGPETTEHTTSSTAPAPPESTTTSPETTTTAPSSTTTAPETTTTTSKSTTTSTPPSSVNDKAEGSGCTPGLGSLSDGEWFGYVVATKARELEFDLACWFTGEAAVEAAKEDGEESPPANDYYVRNFNELTRVLDVAGDAEVIWYPELGDPGSEAEISYQNWLSGIGEREFMPGIWVEIKDGVVIEIHEQWVP